MVEINAWMKQFCENLLQVFPNRIHFVGLQGSYARGEATESSDIDVVVIFDTLDMQDLVRYDEMLSHLPHRKLVCGFVSGLQELANWEAAELFQFYYDTIPFMGTLDELLERINRNAIRRAVITGAGTIYHACVHNFLHEKSLDIIKELYKASTFVIRAVYFLESGTFVQKNADLLEQVSPPEQQVLRMRNQLKNSLALPPDIFPEASRVLFTWSQALLQNKKY